MTRVTLDKLLKEKDNIINAKKNKRQTDLYVASLDGTITIQELTAVEITESAGLGEDGDKYAVYMACVEPDLHDNKLQEAYGCVKPYDIVEQIFKDGEIHRIAQEIITLSGYGEDVVTQIKN